MTVSDGPSAARAGWYPDPADPARLRRWDGGAWTSDVVNADVVNADVVNADVVNADVVNADVVNADVVNADVVNADVVNADAVDADAAITPPAAPAPPFVAPVAPVSLSPPAAAAPVVGRPSPPVEARPATPAPETVPESWTGSLPDWANLPGLTLPPDFSVIPGLSDPVLPVPSFEEPERRMPPPADAPIAPEPDVPEPVAAEPVDAPPTPPATLTRRQLRERREALGEGAVVPPAASAREPVQEPAPPYAPPPAGVQYVAPPPPGIEHTPPATAYPLSTFGMLPSGPPPATAPPVENVQDVPTVAAGTGTLGVWLIAALPLLQLAVVYAIFGVLGESVLPGTQWGILAAPAIFSLLFAMIDRRALLARGHESVPGLLWAIVPPLYLIVRCLRVGPRSLAALIVWVLLQAAAIAGATILLAGVLASVLGITATPTVPSVVTTPTASPQAKTPLTAAQRAAELTQKGMNATILATPQDPALRTVDCPPLPSTADGTQIVCKATTAKGTLFLTEQVDSTMPFVAFRQVASSATGS